MGAQILQETRSCLRILGARRLTWSKVHTEDPQILGAATQNFVTKVTWCLGCVHLWCKMFNDLVYLAGAALLGEDVLSMTGM
jgi:hypothetical protein